MKFKKFLPSVIADQRGHSIMEVITVILFIGIALPTLVLFFSHAIIASSEEEIQSKALMLCEQKMEEILTDKTSSSRGYSWIQTPGRYAAENLSGGFTRSVTITEKAFDSISYLEIVVGVTQSAIPTVQLTCWATQY